uniref:Uncharacterized protein n=1 Tax=Pinctada fucata TaxID=50426 RepID=A0A194AMQ6_PINFU
MFVQYGVFHRMSYSKQFIFDGKLTYIVLCTAGKPQNTRHTSQYSSYDTWCRRRNTADNILICHNTHVQAPMLTPSTHRIHTGYDNFYPLSGL